MAQLDDAVAQIVFAREYTLGLLDTIDPADWFRMPPGGATHVAWQVGHLAMAEYRLCVERVCGTDPADAADVISPAFLALFARDTVPDPDPKAYPPPAELRATLDRVHARALAALAAFPDADLDAPPLTPHTLCATRRACVWWCSAHEMVHAGQIGLLRRLFGQRPMW